MTVPVALALVKGGGLLGSLAKRLKPPSEKRAAKVAPQAIQAANMGNLTAAVMIRDRTTFGIQKERAVWQSALAQIRPEIMAAAQRVKIPAGYIDESTPEAAVASALAHPIMAGSAPAAGPATNAPPSFNPYDVLGKTTAGAPIGAQGQPYIAPPAPQSQPAPSGTRSGMYVRYDPSTGQRWLVTADDPRFSQWSNRRPTASAASRGGARHTHVRYNPDTGARTVVEVGTYEDTNWPSRKPSQKALNRQIQKTGQQVAQTVGRSLPLAAAKLPVGGAAYVAAAGVVSYLVTSKIIEAAQEGQSPQNLYGLALALSHSELTRQLGRQPTREEYTDLRGQVAQSIETYYNSFSLAGQVKNALVQLVSLFR